MKRLIFTAAALALPILAQAQQGMAEPTAHTAHQHMQMPAEVNSRLPREPGQSAFAAIQEIVELLIDDPSTDWTKVNIPALRQHLVDMDNVALRANVSATPTAQGMQFDVTSESKEVRDSIRRMVKAHATTMNGSYGLTYETSERPDGAVMTAHASTPESLGKLEALGFIGVMTLGAHHQTHHLAIAKGMGPHE
ncbi:hypothetical protein KQ940_21300 [Marinobacterium sp. D7]|uniref:hypothetical protein n=1 Tax=Marinobacterium ramblicola TaxID=2849041 RepID=UPI001C2D00DE|nr:hypothetical protein [Marinobacterium ramblicola]MBV1790606.1 hypothetical protein [Marinobacterium ramblicola]